MFRVKHTHLLVFSLNPEVTNSCDCVCWQVNPNVDFLKALFGVYIPSGANATGYETSARRKVCGANPATPLCVLARDAKNVLNLFYFYIEYDKNMLHTCAFSILHISLRRRTRCATNIRRALVPENCFAATRRTIYLYILVYIQVYARSGLWRLYRFVTARFPLVESDKSFTLKYLQSDCFIIFQHTFFNYIF